MKKPLLFKLLLAASILSLPAGRSFAASYDFSAKNDDGKTIRYNITSSTDLTVEVASGTYTGSVSIPSTVEYDGVTYTVTGIGSSAFSSCKELTSVYLPGSITSIGKYGFASCETLGSVTFENGSKLTDIGDYAFQNCYSLGSIEIPTGITSIGSDVFYWCSALTYVGMPSGITSIGKEAFYYCAGLDQITIPSKVTSIGNDAFAYSGLIQVNIPGGTSTIGSEVFNCCSSLRTVTFDTGSKLKSLASCAFNGCKNLVSVDFGDNAQLTAIENYAFFGCENLVSIELPENLTSIGTDTFWGCEGLVSITSLNPEPPECANSDVFEAVDMAACSLTVPEGFRDAYAGAYVWKEFQNITEPGMAEMPSEPGLTDISSVDSGTDREIIGYYTIGGERINTLAKGMTVVRYSDGTSKKVLVK